MNWAFALRSGSFSVMCSLIEASFMKRQQFFHLMCLFPAIGLLVGCGGEKVDRPDVYKVRGKITLQGKPVSGADITFSQREANRSAFGRTDENGEYQLTTFTANDGAIEGKHEITIVEIPPIASTPALPDIESESYQPPGLGEETMPVPKSSLNARYADPATSGLIAVVNKDGENVIDFDLKP
jgi:hypothetical protein